MARQYQSPDMSRYRTGNRQYSEAYSAGKSSWQSGGGRSFHGGGDTYDNQKIYVDGLGNSTASENFGSTRPHFE